MRGLPSSPELADLARQLAEAAGWEDPNPVTLVPALKGMTVYISYGDGAPGPLDDASAALDVLEEWVGPMLVVSNAMSKRTGTVLDSDVLFRFRLQLLAHAAELGNITEACRTFGVHRSTYYHWKRQVEQAGLEMLRPRERRAPRMPNQIPPFIEQRILTFSLAHPGLGPRRIRVSLAQERWGGIVVSPNGVWRVLRRHGLRWQPSSW